MYTSTYIYVCTYVSTYVSIQRSNTEDTIATPNPINPCKDQKQWQ